MDSKQWRLKMQGYIKEYNEFKGIGVISSLYGEFDFDIKDWRSQEKPVKNLVVEFMSGSTGIAFSIYDSNPRAFVGRQLPSECPCDSKYRWVATRTWWAVTIVTLLFPVTWFGGLDSNLAVGFMAKGAEMYWANMIPMMAIGFLPVVIFDSVVSSFKKDVRFLEIVIMAMTLLYSMGFLRQTVGLFQNVGLDSPFGVCCAILAALFCVRLTN